MIGRVVGFAAACALGANAFLLPPGLSTFDKQPDLSVKVVDATQQILRLPCAECLFTPKQETGEVAEKVPWDLMVANGALNDLVLNFTITEDSQALEFNGVPIWPLQAVVLDRPTIKQVIVNTDDVEIASGRARGPELTVDGFGVSEGDAHALTPNGDVLVPLRVHIISVEDQLLSLPVIRVELLKTSDEELLIVRVMPMDSEHRLPMPEDGVDDIAELKPHHGFHGPPSGPDFKHKECDVLPASLCKLKNIIESKIDDAMGPPGPRHGGCPGREGHGPPHMRPGFLRPDHEGEDGPHFHHHHGRPHHMRPHGHHHGHHRGHFWRHHFLRVFAKGLVAVMIPVFAGITVGMAVSLVGLIVGRLVSFLWIKIVRRGCRGYASVALDENTAELADEKTVVAEMDAPPVYEDAPTYEEVQKDAK